MYVFAILGFSISNHPQNSLLHTQRQTHTFCLFLSFSFLTFALMEPESLTTHVRGIWIQNLLFHPNMFYQLNLNHLATPHNFFFLSKIYFCCWGFWNRFHEVKEVCQFLLSSLFIIWLGILFSFVDIKPINPVCAAAKCPKPINLVRTFVMFCCFELFFIFVPICSVVYFAFLHFFFCFVQGTLWS